MSILIQKVQLNGKTVDIAVRGNRIAEIRPGIEGKFDQVIDGSGCAALPPFYNTHCHAAMTLLRGIADDMELFDWLSNHIWPAEAKLTPEDIYWGTRLACLEMIKSGTVFFNDMYFQPAETIRAVEDAGIRAAVGMIVLDVNPDANAAFQRANEAVWADRARYSDRIQLAWSPHAIYTVSEPALRKVAEKAAEMQVRIHIHVAETDKEVSDCREQHGGLTPVEYLDRLGLLSEMTLAAHSVHLSDSDIDLLKARGVHTAYMPCSNYKLSSGRFRFHKLLESGCHVTFGTDGCASNNNLSMFDEMKVGALGAKLEFGGPTACSAPQIFHAATRSGAVAFGIDAGVLEPGRLADIMLLDLDSPMMVAAHNLISNVVYSADSSCVSTVICDGRVLMLDRQVPGEAEVIREARRCSEHLRG
ncbi:MAG: amidohydrolase [Lentisphaeria bacterium]|nr:amidohydrolase [Lentisphaeria bacterium]